MTDIPVKPPLLLRDLTGPAGNAYAILGECEAAVKNALRQGLTLPDDYFDTFHAEATSSDYAHLLKTVDEYFNVVTREGPVRKASAVELADPGE